MFERIKSQVDILELISKDLDLNLKEIGTDTYGIEDEKDFGGCPFCGHMDCFRIKKTDTESFFKCFSCNENGSVIDWVSKRKNLTLVEAATQIAKEYNIPLPNDYNPIQEIFDIAAKFYENCLWETCNTPNFKTSGMTPVEYQARVRKHDGEALKAFHVGWSNGSLVEFLESVGYNEDILLESGLKNRKTKRDFLPKDCFIYPHYAKGRVSHFTFKDPLKKVPNYQLPNKFVLNGCEFYGQDTLSGAKMVLIVEGENDVISCWKSRDSKDLGVIGTIGSISGDQLEWMRVNLAGKEVITCFDPDDAGDKYREKVEKIKGAFKSLVQVLPPDGKDIDEHISAGANLVDILTNNVVKVATTRVSELAGLGNKLQMQSQGADGEQAVPEVLIVGQGDGGSSSGSDSLENNSIIERNCAYYRVRFKDGEPNYAKISNFVMELFNVYITEDGERLREIVITKENGSKSERVLINSDTKVSLKAFRTAVAKAADADFKGTDLDLGATWELVYSKCTERHIQIVQQAGRLEKYKAWVFRNRLLMDSGTIISPDEEGIFWISPTLGIKPDSINKRIISGEESLDIPFLDDTFDNAEYEQMLKTVLGNMVEIEQGDIGLILCMMGWIYSNAYSNSIFAVNRCFPLLFIWGKMGYGKGVISSWLMSIYGMDPCGSTSIPNLKSGVGFMRKAEYYSSLPQLVDDVRADAATIAYEPLFRIFFDRQSRDKGTREGRGIETQPVRSCLMFTGEDQFHDQALRERCLHLRLHKLNAAACRANYEWMMDNKSLLSVIGNAWIRESITSDHNEVVAQVREMEDQLTRNSILTARKAKLWAAVAVFAKRLAEKYYPDFDIISYIRSEASSDMKVQEEDGLLGKFFDVIEVIKNRERNDVPLDRYIMRDGDKLYVWFKMAHEQVEAYSKSKSKGTIFSYRALLGAIRDEPYFLSENKRVYMGIGSNRTFKAVVELDLTKCPEVIQSIAGYEDPNLIN